MELDRRTALAALAAVPALAAGPAVAAGRTRRRTALDLASPADRLRAFRLMRGGLDEALAVSWVSARYYGVVEDRMDPLFAVVSAVFSRSRSVADGGFDMVSFELAWFTDPDSGKALDTWRNPYTGQEVKVPSGGFNPSRVHFSPNLDFSLAKPIPGLEMAHEVLPFDARGDDVWVTERSRTALTFPGAPRPFRYSESNTFHASRAALEAPGATRVTSAVAFTNVCSWRPWMGMGDRPGHLTATGIGRQNAARDSLPPAWVEATTARRPEVLRDPGAILAPLWPAG
ncbi:DUF1838 family protein [Novosphingobium piscinae]|uniref:DUF1838 family protein n=1 Tax=Novosphingobium piscinae TaxID=1507448 RepID=A0A7X1FZI4_9SPHN|nr:DUF1838 family protein [Novosphingobium piscinae]MBC2669878.1 DUF1838 family protein [Novosphingobium piscinae]